MIQDLDFHFLVSDFSSFSVLLPFLAGLVFYKKLEIDQRILYWFVVLATATEFIATGLAKQEINNMPVLHLFTVLEFIIFMIYFRCIFQQAGKVLHIVIPVLAFVAFSVINVIYFEPLLVFNSNGLSLTSLTFMLLALYYLYLLATRGTVLYLTDFPAFWGTTAVLFYFAGSLFIFAYSRFFLEKWQAMHPAIWSIHGFFNIGFHILLTRALWKPKTA